MARTLQESYVFRGVVYVPGPNGTVTDPSGNPLDLPDDFPSDAELAEFKRKSLGASGSASAALEQTIATTEKAEESKAKRGKK